MGRFHTLMLTAKVMTQRRIRHAFPESDRPEEWQRLEDALENLQAASAVGCVTPTSSAKGFQVLEADPDEEENSLPCEQTLAELPKSTRGVAMLQRSIMNWHNQTEANDRTNYVVHLEKSALEECKKDIASFKRLRVILCDAIAALSPPRHLPGENANGDVEGNDAQEGAVYLQGRLRSIVAMILRRLGDMALDERLSPSLQRLREIIASFEARHGELHASPIQARPQWTSLKRMTARALGNKVQQLPSLDLVSALSTPWLGESIPLQSSEAPDIFGLDGAPNAEEKTEKTKTSKRRRCVHGQQPSRCSKCNTCEHGRVRRDCGRCSPCVHGNIRRTCTKCNGCSHGRLLSHCKVCRSCPHGKLKYQCSRCRGCPHGKLKHNCPKCIGCPHGKVKHACQICGACPHGKVRHNCTQCVGCEHGRVRYACKLCKARRLPKMTWLSKGSLPKEHRLKTLWLQSFVMCTHQVA